MAPKIPDDPLTDSRDFATPYREETAELDPDDVTKAKFECNNTIDITYWTNANTKKTVRAIGAKQPISSREDLTDDVVTFFDGDQEYAFNPEEMTLQSVGRNQQNVTVATSEDFISFEKVLFPDRVPVVGAVSEDVEATVYYRSAQSGNIKTMDVDVSTIEGRHAVGSIRGTAVDRDRLVEIYPNLDRRVKSRGRQEKEIGKVLRIEFPRGHGFSVEVENLPEDKVDKAEAALKTELESALSYTDVEVSVTHDGPISWE